MIGALLARIAIPAPVQAGWALAKAGAARVPPIVWKLLAAVLLVLLARWHWIDVGKAKEHAKTVKVQSEFSAYRAAALAVAAQARADAKAVEQSQADQFATVADQLQKDQAHALASRDSVIADLRSGALKLRKQWACPAGIHLPETAAGASGGDDSANLRQTGAGDLIGLADAADAQVTACQSILRAER
jgi:hypothetical protein